MPAAIAIPAIIGAAGVGAQVVGARNASNAAKDAARIQGQSADRAQAFNERVYGDQQQLMSPYVKAGSDSLARLMAQHWGTQPPAGMSPSGGSSAMLSNAARGFIPQQGPFSGAPQAQPGGGNPNSLAAMQGGGGQQMPPQGAPMPQGGQMPPQGGGQMVKLQGPDGSTRDVPAQLADQFIARGARRIG
jgi:hypothetical protein